MLILPIPEWAVAEATDTVPADLSNGPLQSPQVASDDNTAGAIQIAGEVVKYDNVGFQLNRNHWQSGFQQHSAVSDFVTLKYALPPLPHT